MLVNFSPISYLYLTVYVVVTFSIFIFKDFFFLWIIIELQIIAFISLAFDSSEFSSYGLSSYFLVQSLCSLMILFFYYSYALFDSSSLLLLSFMLKLGVFPFVNWYVNSIAEFSTFLLLLGLTVQNIPSLILLFNVLDLVSSSDYMFILLLVLILNILYCSFISLSCFTPVSTFVWLSMASTFWVVLSGLFSIGVFLVYYFVYSFFVLMFFFNSLGLNNLSFTISLLNLSGLPPFPDFFLNVLMISLSFDLFLSYSWFVPMIIGALLFNVVYILSIVIIILKTYVFSFLNLA